MRPSHFLYKRRGVSIYAYPIMSVHYLPKLDDIQLPRDGIQVKEQKKRRKDTCLIIVIYHLPVHLSHRSHK
jgi:hypothetical protein